MAETDVLSIAATPALVTEAARGFDVVMLTTAHIADDTRIFHYEAKTLTAAGLSVCIVGRQVQQPLRDGVSFIDVPTPRTHLQRFLLARSVFRTAMALHGRLYIFHDPELFGVALALRLRGKSVVYDCHENVPVQVLKKTWIPKLLRWLLVPALWVSEWVLARLVSGVMVARERVASRFPRNRTVLVRNFPTRQTLELLGQGGPIEKRRNIVIYAGGLSVARGTQELVEAFKNLNRKDAELWLVGDFEDRELKQRILQSLPENIKFFGWRDRDEVLHLYQQAKIGAVTLHPTPSHRHSMPLKLFEYMGAGLLVLASNFPELTRFVEGCGVQVDPTNIAEIQKALEKLLDPVADIAKMSQTGRERVLRELIWENEGARLVEFCHRMMLPANAR